MAVSAVSFVLKLYERRMHECQAVNGRIKEGAQGVGDRRLDPLGS